MKLVRNLRIPIWGRDKWKHICIVLFLFLLAFLVSLKSPLNLWQGADAGTDSSVFKYVAFLMDEGYMPYRDTFDHKGPLIYLINFLGNCISCYRGIWLIELAVIFVTFLLMYRISRLCSGKLASAVAVLFSASLLLDFFEGGNLVEEYAMPFIAAALLIYLDYFINGEITGLRLITCGFCFGCVCMLRPNMISVWLVFSVAVLLSCIREKQDPQTRHFIKYALCRFFVGFSVLTVPIMAWLFVNGAYSDFIRDYIIFNSIYSSAGTVFSGRWNAFFLFFNKWPVLFVVIVCAYQWKKKKVFYWGVYISYLLLTLILITISGRSYGHYGMVLVPAVVFPIASVLGEIQTGCKIRGGAAAFILIYILSSAVIPAWLSVAGGAASLYEERNGMHQSDLVADICAFIQKNTRQADAVSVYGNWDIIYVLSRRMSASRYSYQFPVGEIHPPILDEYFNELTVSPPKLVIVQAGCMDERMSRFLRENAYTQTWSMQSGSGDVACIYQLGG